MTWIKTIAYGDADPKLKRLYDRVKGPDNNVDNVMLAHSLRPHTMEGHMAIYKQILHHTANSLPKWFLEAIGVWVSSLNACAYCIEHHFSGMKRLLADDSRADAIRRAFKARDLQAAPLNEAQKLALNYARILTENPATLNESHIEALRGAGYTDGEILEINQVAAYFNYANRTVLGLGCSTKGDIIGLSPNNSNDPDDWKHR